MARTAIAFVDDHPILLDGLTRIFSEHEDFDVVGRGSSIADLMQVAASGKAEVIVADLNMPGNVFEAIKALSTAYPAIKIVAFTASVGVDHAVQALEAGARGFVVKGSTAAELVDALQAVVEGETFITQSFATKVITALRNASLRKMAAQAIRLSAREDQIVKLLLRGKTNKEIASQLQISEKTVKHYMTILMQKLNARNRIEVVLAAQRLDGGVAGSEGYEFRN